ncbi:hypothetical protein NCCP1664_21890 [Zafaria cholistanensis]|uniref:Uncharacterized protein n=1 Tax=Zafaria cholistanensis TaxID=1682741 RepID=A0A5A7NS26_9MICC|nr:hypothetical protein NCCP1664_21890 [Zafaria cholistanensis]
MRVRAGAGVHHLQPPADPLDLDALRSAALRRRAMYGAARRRGDGRLKVAVAGLQWLGAQAAAARPLRTWNLYTARRGPLMAAGNAYNMFFSIAAAAVVGFSILGLVLSGNPQWQEAVVRTVARAVPGLIDTGGGGLARPAQLFSARSFGWALAISTATLAFTSLHWISSVRQGVRGIFGLELERINPLVKLARDLGLLVLAGLALLLTTALGALTGAALDLVIGWLRLDAALVAPLARIAGLGLMLALDMMLAVGLFRFASAISMPRRAMLQAALLAGLGATVLRYFSSLLLGTVGNNPLLAPFAVVLGLFVWFNLLSQIYLLAAAWGAVAAADARARAAAEEGLDGLSLRRRAGLLRPSRRRG